MAAEKEDMPPGLDGSGQRDGSSLQTLSFQAQCFCRVRVSSRGDAAQLGAQWWSHDVATTVTPGGRHKVPPRSPPTKPVSAMALRGAEHQNTSCAASLLSAHLALGWHHLSCLHQPGGRRMQDGVCTTLALLSHLGSWDGAPSNPSATSSFEDPRQTRLFAGCINI